MSASTLGTILVLGLLVVMLMLPLYTQVHNVMTQGRTDAYETAAFVNSTIPHDEIIETWEQELGVLSDRKFHYPPQIALAKSVAAQWFGDAPVSKSYDFRTETDAAYVIVGPFAEYTHVYPADRLADYTLIDTIGNYDIYQRNPTP
jgi:hypothetical protein